MINVCLGNAEHNPSTRFILKFLDESLEYAKVNILDITMKTLRAVLFPNTSKIQTIGISGILILAISMWISTAGAHFGLFLIFVATLTQFSTPEYRKLLRDPVTIGLAVIIAYVLIWDLALSVLGPDLGKYDATRKWLYILIPWCSYWFYKYPRLVMPILILAATSKLIETIVIVPQYWDTFVNAWSGGHVFKAKGYGFYFSCVLLGLMIYLPRFYHWLRQFRLFPLGMTIYFMLILWFLQCLAGAQSRTSWLFFFLALILVAIVSLRRYYRQQKIILPNIAQITVAVLLATLILVTLQYQQIKSNFLRDDAANVVKIVRGDPNLTYSSATHRYLLYRLATELWLQSPFLGQGPIDSSYYVDHHKDKRLHVDGHFHSSYLEILVSFGLVGLLMFAGLSYVLLKRFYQNYRKGMIAPDLALFIASVFLLAGLWNLFNSRFIHVDWRFFWILLIGITHAASISASMPAEKYQGEHDPDYR